MSDEGHNPQGKLLTFAESVLKRELSMAEKQVLSAFLHGTTSDFATASQGSVALARQQIGQQIQRDTQLTSQVIKQVRQAENFASHTSQQREQFIQKLLTAADTLTQPPVAQEHVGDPELKALLTQLVKQEVGSYMQAHVSGLTRQLEQALLRLGEKKNP